MKEDAGELEDIVARNLATFFDRQLPFCQIEFALACRHRELPASQENDTSR